jgi:hypothetical protein
MNCKVGDKIRFLNDVGGGTVIRIISASMICVEDEDGFEMPVLASNVVVVGDEKNPQNRETGKMGFSEKNKPVKLMPKEPEPKIEEDFEIMPENDGDNYEISLAFLPSDSAKPAECDVELFIINDSTYYCMYAVSLWTKQNKLSLMGRGDLSPDSKEPVCMFRRENMNSAQTLSVTCFLYKHRDYLIHQPVQVNVELNPLRFVRNSSFVENDFFDEQAYILKVASDYEPESMEITVDPEVLSKAMKQKKEHPTLPATPVSPAIEEIDLHIEALTDDWEDLEPAQILDIQKSRFAVALDLGMRTGTRRMVFIHGVGNGKLKHEIRRLLDTQYAGKVRYQDASFKEYGYGATMVLL